MIEIIVTLIVVGVLLWAVNALIPMDPKIQKVVNVLAIVFVILWLLSAFGLFHLPIRP